MGDSQDLWVSKKSSRDGNALFLTAAEHRASASHNSREAISAYDQQSNTKSGNWYTHGRGMMKS